MKVLVITGDKSFKSGNPRFDVQASAVEKFEAVYVGWGSLWPRLPEGNFDVVTSQDPFFRGLIARKIAKKFNARFNVQVHADIAKQSVFKKLIAPIVLRKADSIRVVSENLKTQVESMNVKSPVTVLPIYIDMGPYKAAVRNPGPHPTVLWTGRFEDEKDPLLAVDTLREVLQEIPNTEMVMLGTGSLEKKLKDYAKDLPVTFPGWQNPADYLSKAWVVLSTSKAESWGASIVEALASKVPVVSPDVGIAKEAGAFVVPKDILADKLIEVLKKRSEGKLRVSLPNKEEWLDKWKETLA